MGVWCEKLPYCFSFCVLTCVHADVHTFSFLSKVQRPSLFGLSTIALICRCLGNIVTMDDQQVGLLPSSGQMHT